MANALDAVLELRRQEQARQEAQSQALTQAATIFMQARQLKQQEQLKKLELAQQQKQFDVEQNDPLKQLIRKGQAVEAARSMGDRDLFNTLTGRDSTPANPITQPIQSAEQTVGQPVVEDDAILYQQANEVDPMTEKPTARAEQAKAILAEKTSAKTASLKSETELNRKQGVLLRIGKRIVDEYTKTEPSENRALQLASIPGSMLQMTPGQKKDATYRSFVTSLKAQLARGQGEVGNLSSQEQQVVLDAVGSLGDTKTVGFDKMINYFKNIAEVSTDKATKEEALGMLDRLQRTKTGNVNPATTQEAEQEVFRAKSDTTPLGILSKAMRNTVNPMIDGATFGFLDSASDKVGANPSDRFVSEDSQMKELSRFVGGSASILGARGLNAVKSGKASKDIIAKSQSGFTKLEGDQILNASVKNTRANILAKDGYIAQEHKIYAQAIDKIKGSDVPVKGADDLLRKFALSNKNETTLKFNTPEMQSVYDSLSQKFSASGKLTETDIVNAMKSLKGKFGTGKVDVAKRMNLNAAHELSQGLSSVNQKTLKVANIKYSAFKNNEKDIDDLIGLYAKSKKTDSIVSGLLSKDLGIEQSKVARFIGDRTGIDLLNQINYHRGINQIKDSFWLSRQIDSFISGARKVVGTKIKGGK